MFRKDNLSSGNRRGSVLMGQFDSPAGDTVGVMVELDGDHVMRGELRRQLG